MPKIKLKDIKPNPDNPRFILDENHDKLVNSIKDFPKMMELRPIIVNDQNVILGGNMRYNALEAIGYKEIPDTWIKKASDLSEEEQQEFIIKDNVGFGSWDWKLLLTDHEPDQLEAWGLHIPDMVFDEPEPAGDDGFTMPAEIETDIKPGELIKMGDHLLLCGDATRSDDWKRLMENDSVDLVVTDPPYNVNYEGRTAEKLKIQSDHMDEAAFALFLLHSFQNMHQHLKEGASIYCWYAGSKSIAFYTSFDQAGFKLSQTLIWKKSSLVLGRNDYHFKHEPCIYGWKKGAAHNWYSDRTQTTILEFDRPARNGDHPTMKPVELIEYQIGNSSKVKDIVADPFSGSGTTMVACEQPGRQCRSMELDPKYCQVILNRMTKLKPDLVIQRNYDRA